MLSCLILSHDPVKPSALNGTQVERHLIGWLILSATLVIWFGMFSLHYFNCHLWVGISLSATGINSFLWLFFLSLSVCGSCLTLWCWGLLVSEGVSIYMCVCVSYFSEEMYWAINNRGKNSNLNNNDSNIKNASRGGVQVWCGKATSIILLHHPWLLAPTSGWPQSYRMAAFTTAITSLSWAGRKGKWTVVGPWLSLPRIFPGPPLLSAKNINPGHTHIQEKAP